MGLPRPSLTPWLGSWGGAMDLPPDIDASTGGAVLLRARLDTPADANRHSAESYGLWALTIGCWHSWRRQWSGNSAASFPDVSSPTSVAWHAGIFAWMSRQFPAAVEEHFVLHVGMLGERGFLLALQLDAMMMAHNRVHHGRGGDG